MMLNLRACVGPDPQVMLEAVADSVRASQAAAARRRNQRAFGPGLTQPGWVPALDDDMPELIADADGA